MSLQISDISKSFKDLKALKHISLEVRENELFGLIGPDGAGKTTLFRILASLLLPDEGQANVAGFDVIKDYKQLRKNIGYMPGKFSLYQDLTVEENLNFFATIFNSSIEENYDLIKDIYVQIEPFKKRKAGDLSGGMKQKLALSCALIHKPKVLFLDEPTTGVDPVSRNEFWGMLKKLQKKGITIFVSTPYMDEAALCDRIAFINQGEILQVDTPSAIVKNFAKQVLNIQTPSIYKALRVLGSYQHTHSIYPFGESLHYMDSRKDFDWNEVLNHLKNEEIKDVEGELISPEIEDVFMELSRN
ncbi:ABC transporter ATP-binding protein [Psychroflexus sp. CAK8W]|uniref:ABC transporter ATP-binding protein n=1 Tax=Psychroflexus longus TaxID=2873596 RepID=A0ABS7XHN5_9FLAO|nr:ABC transporter ATP-binding protein [Psychroflexus longus]MBZ9778463.1 ABC transporter ATP-binding protein [Psychroflexus longus]